MDPIPLPAPYGGVNEQIPIISLQSPFAKNLMNFNVTQEGVSVRHGDSNFAKISRGSGNYAHRVCAYGDQKLLLVVGNVTTNKIDIYDAETMTVLFSSAASGPNGLFSSFYFNNYLFFLETAGYYSPGFFYNGSSFGTIGYTGTALRIMGGSVYKERAYLIQYNESAYWYTNIKAISGAVTKVDLTYVVSEKCTLMTIAPITVADSVSTQTFLAFVFSSGEVLFYQGSYPDSASWGTVGKARIGSPIDFNAKIEYQGDSLLLCDNGVVSLRDLFLKGSEAAQSLTVNTRIQKSWSKLIAAVRRYTGASSGAATQFVNAVWDRFANRIIISVGFYLDNNGNAQLGSTYFVFDTILKSWFFHSTFSSGLGAAGLIIDVEFYKNKTLLLLQGSSYISLNQKEGGTGFTDRHPDDNADIGFYYETESAPITNGRAYVQKGEGLDVILKSDLFNETNYQLIKEFGVETSDQQNVTDVLSGVVQKPFVNVGIEGSFIQYKISGVTTAGKTYGLDLYGVNFWIEMGASPR